MPKVKLKPRKKSSNITTNPSSTSLWVEKYPLSPPPKKVSRPDVSLRRKNRSNIIETVVPCSLSGRLGLPFNDPCRLLLRTEIDNWVISTSKIVHRLSLIFNRLLLYLLQNNLPFPKFESSLFTGLALHGMKQSTKKSKEKFHSLIDDFCDNEFNVDYGQYPNIQRQRGDCQAIVIACNKYETNFKNTIHVPFFIRQKSYIKTWLQVKDITDVKAWDIQKKINGWSSLDDEFPLIVREFILEERRLLGDPINLCDDWLKKRTSIQPVISYYYHILKFFHVEGVGKKFRLAPLCQVKCHFLSVDNTVLREILINVRKEAQKQGMEFPEDISDAIDQKDMNDCVWKAVFNYDGLRRRRRFSHHVDTNGVKVCFHFQTSKKKVNRRNRRVRAKRKFNAGDRIISIDPGRVNLITAYDDVRDDFYRLTRKEYYTSSGMGKRMKTVNKRNLELKGVYEAMSRTPTKSADDKDWYQYQEMLTRNYDKIWEFKTRKVWRSEDLRIACLKEKCLDRFFNKFLIKGEKKPVVAYGASCFNPTGKGEMAVPVKYVYKKCSERFHTEKENERYSTKMHFKCKESTMGVMVGSKKTRGLRWCSTCRELVSRDNNACKNIMCSYKAEERPEYLCDTYVRPEEEIRRIRGCNHTKRCCKKELRRSGQKVSKHNRRNSGGERKRKVKTGKSGFKK